MNKEELISEIKAKFQAYQNGIGHWLDIAPLLEQAKLMGLNTRTILNNKGRVWEISCAYDFLKAQRPDFLKNPNLTTGAEAISYLTPIYKKMTQEERDNKFQDLVDDVLSGKIRIATLRIMAKKQKVNQAEDLPTSKNNAPCRSQRASVAHKIKAVENAIDVLDFLFDVALEDISHNELRKFLESKCHNLSIRLSCVASQEFYNSWRQKKEGTI